MEVKAMKLGAEIRGVDLSRDLSDEEARNLIQLVHKHRMVVFKDQHQLSGRRQVELTKLLGGLDTSVVGGDPLFPHPKTPHPQIFRISNDPEEGCTNAGRLGWHIDGALFEKPFSFTILHVIHAPQQGATEYVGFTELLDSLTPEVRQRWERLWSFRGKDNCRVNPLIHTHPVTKQKGMCFHLGFVEAFIWDHGTEAARTTGQGETEELKREITNEILKDNGRLVYSHEYEDGEFVIFDNLAIGHFASEETQLPRSKVGLRVLHRTTVNGRSVLDNAKSEIMIHCANSLDPEETPMIGVSSGSKLFGTVIVFVERNEEILTLSFEADDTKTKIFGAERVKLTEQEAGAPFRTSDTLPLR